MIDMKSRGLTVTVGALILTVLAAAITLSRRSPPEPATIDAGTGGGGGVLGAITCLGRISPEDAVVKISGRSLSGQPSIVSALFVKEGDVVKAGQLLAVLNSGDQLQAARVAMDAAVTLSERRLGQVKAAGKAADVQAQTAEIARIELELANAEADLRIWESLKQQKAVADLEYDAKKLARDVRRQQLRQAQERLRSLSEVRDVDVSVAEAELISSRARARLALAEWEQSQVKAPTDGRVIEIHAWPGEEIRSGGILELAKTNAMYVVAEVPEGDVRRLRTGQRATMTGDALPEPLEGRVERIGSKVAKNDVLGVDPIAVSDVRVVEARIRLIHPEKALGLIHAQVSVRIEP
jgi:HlyD family secretion protein